MAARDANARAKGVTAPRVASPTKEAIAKFKEVKQRRDEARKKGGGGYTQRTCSSSSRGRRGSHSRRCTCRHRHPRCCLSG
jgi:hypothetical protein